MALFCSRFVECIECGRKMHQICVLHNEIIWPSGYVAFPFVFIYNCKNLQMIFGKMLMVKFIVVPFIVDL